MKRREFIKLSAAGLVGLVTPYKAIKKPLEYLAKFQGNDNFLKVMVGEQVYYIPVFRGD